jgi:hypothetical protein
VLKVPTHGFHELAFGTFLCAKAGSPRHSQRGLQLAERHFDMCQRLRRSYERPKRVLFHGAGGAVQFKRRRA